MQTCSHSILTPRSAVSPSIFAPLHLTAPLPVPMFYTLQSLHPSLHCFILLSPQQHLTASLRTPYCIVSHLVLPPPAPHNIPRHQPHTTTDNNFVATRTAAPSCCCVTGTCLLKDAVFLRCHLACVIFQTTYNP